MAPSASPPPPRRSFLFAPGSRPDLFGKALATGADIVCIDLEDAVAPALKAAAREPSFDFLDQRDGTVERAVRINPLRSHEGLRDLIVLADRSAQSGATTRGLLVMTKVDDAEEVRIVDALLTEAGAPLDLVLLIETARGLDAVMELAAAPRVVSLLFGAVDLSAELGVAVAHEPLLYARSRVVHAAKKAGIGAFDVPCLDFRNLDIVKTECEMARSLGFTGKAVLHPSNVAVVNAVFSPSADEIARARAIVAAFEASPTGLAVLDGKLVEKPVVRAAQNVLARARSME
jgi:citrate lyase beta subunit